MIIETRVQARESKHAAIMIEVRAGSGDGLGNRNSAKGQRRVEVVLLCLSKNVRSLFLTQMDMKNVHTKMEIVKVYH